MKGTKKEKSDVAESKIDFKLFESISDIKKQNEKEALNKLLKECIKEWCENTTSHGFANMVRTDSWFIRISWILLVIVFMGYCFYSVILSVQMFFTYSTNINYQIISESPSNFPSVTFCNLNPFDVTTYANTGTYILQKLKSNNISPEVVLSDTDYSIVRVQEIGNMLRASITSDNSMNETTKKSFGFSIDTLLISCFYGDIKCLASEFNWFRDHDFGNCYTFNGLFDSNGTETNSKTTSKAGPINGLNMEIFVGSSTTQDYYTFRKGVKIVIHERGIRPLLKYDGITVGVKSSAEISITRTNYSKLDHPYSNCRKEVGKVSATDSTYYKYTIKVSKYYQKLCYEICMQYVQIIPNCACADPSIPIVEDNQTICSTSKQLMCVKTQRDSFDSQQIDDVCGQHCPLECKSVIYSTTESFTSYPTDYYLDLLMSQTNLLTKFNTANTFSPGGTVSSVSVSTNSSNKTNTTTSKTSTKTSVTQTELSNSVLQVSIFYQDLKYTYIEENAAITLDTLIGIIGGQFGLFMGASFLSFVEILEMLINLVRVFIKYNKGKKMIRVAHSK